MSRTLLIAGALALFSASVSEAAVARSGQVVMGTVLTVTVLADTAQDAQRLVEEAILEARRWDDALTIWRPEGELQVFNSRAGQGAQVVSERLALGLVSMLSFSAQTGGAFEPLLPLAGAHSDTAVFAPRRIGDVLKVDGRRARLAKDVALDSGGIGKGLALDAMADLLRAQGVESAFLDFGGSSQTALGAPPGEARGWGVLLAGLAPETSHGVFRLRDASLSTSRAGAQDTRAIEDPRTGRPVAGGRVATVLASRATAADVWSTAVVVLGGAGAELGQKLGLGVFLEDDQGVVRVGPLANRP